MPRVSTTRTVVRNPLCSKQGNVQDSWESTIGSLYIPAAHTHVCLKRYKYVQYLAEIQNAWPRHGKMTECGVRGLLLDKPTIACRHVAHQSAQHRSVELAHDSLHSAEPRAPTPTLIRHQSYGVVAPSWSVPSVSYLLQALLVFVNSDSLIKSPMVLWWLD
jgi:hypothetical protein